MLLPTKKEILDLFFTKDTYKNSIINVKLIGIYEEENFLQIHKSFDDFVYLEQKDNFILSVVTNNHKLNRFYSCYFYNLIERKFMNDYDLVLLLTYELLEREIVNGLKLYKNLLPDKLKKYI